MNPPIEWRGGIDGAAVIEDQLIGSAPDLLRYIREHTGSLSDSQLSWLGAVTFFLALREFGATNEPVLPRVEKALDSFYPVFPDVHADRLFSSGINGLREGLFRFRGDPYESLLHAAFELIKARTVP